jgi:2-dehydropantoate 2-reductase
LENCSIIIIYGVVSTFVYTRGVTLVLKLLVVGLGAVGTVLACLLKEQGHQVSGLELEPSASIIISQGVKVTGIWGDHAAKLDHLSTSAKQIRDHDYDLVIMTVKSFNTEQVSAQIAGLVGPGAYVFLAQNGFGNYEAAAKSIPEEKIILGRVIFGAETLSPGYSAVTVTVDDLALGSPKNLIDPQVLAMFAMMFNDSGIPTSTSERVMEYVWGKIIYNLALNPLGAILGVAYGKLAENGHTRMLMNRMISETFAVLHAMGQSTPWTDAEAFMHDFYGKLVPSTASHHASMLQDIQHGRKTEIDALNGAVVQLGRAYGIATPVNEVVASLVRAKENLVMQPKL